MIDLSSIKPSRWRRVAGGAFAKLQRVIQVAMDWTDSRLHRCKVARERYGVPDPEFDFGEPVISEVEAKPGKSPDGASSLRYVYVHASLQRIEL